MIIGNGMLANALQHYDTENIIFFASGVSNSLEKNPSEFKREMTLLKSVIKYYPYKKLIYFSSCSIYDPSKIESPYVIHKLTIETMITTQCSNFIIFRVGNAVGRGGNPNTLINFLTHSILAGNKLTIHNNARRILIGTDDIALFVGKYLQKLNNKIINLAYPYQYSLLEILSHLEHYLGKKADYESINEGAFYNIEFNSLTENFFLDFTPDKYLTKLCTYYL